MGKWGTPGELTARQKWYRAFSSDKYIKASGGLPLSDISLPEKPLIDTSGSLGGLGGAFLGRKLASFGAVPKNTSRSWIKVQNTIKSNPKLGAFLAGPDAKRQAIASVKDKARILNTSELSAMTIPDINELVK